ncbi:MAG TPA: hypothetical protein VIM79_18050 [Niastella sp.]
MIDHILFFTYLPLTKKIEEDFYIRELIAHNYKVTYVDLSIVYGKSAAAASQEYPAYVTRIASVAEFENIIRSVSEHTLVIPIVTFNYQVLQLFKIVSKYNLRLGFFGRGMIPTPALQKSLLQRVFSNIGSYMSIKRLGAFLQNKVAFYHKLFGKVKRYDIVFSAGRYGVLTIGTGNELDIKTAKIIDINYFDYDKYLDLETMHAPLVAEPYCVFIDQYLPYHPDIKLFGLKNINPQKYFDSLNNYFDEIEKRFRLKVVIAAHPKADYSNNPYKGRQILTYQTAELVKFSEFALTHNSTSVSFCILYNKPIVILYNEEVGELFNRKQMQFLSNFIGGSFADTDLPAAAQQLNELQIDREKYEHYKYNFLTSGNSEREKTVNIFINSLSQL